MGRERIELSTPWSSAMCSPIELPPHRKNKEIQFLSFPISLVKLFSDIKEHLDFTTHINP